MSKSRSIRLDEKTEKILDILRERKGIMKKHAIAEAVINYWGPLRKNKKE